MTTEREFDIALFQIQMEVDELFEKWQVEFRGPRLAHQRAQVAPPPKLPPPTTGQAGYPQ
jgi:hypothetical protein